MGRSIRVREDCLAKVKSSLLASGYPTQKLLAEAVNLNQSTISNFLTGKGIYFLNFVEVCHALNLDWQAIADLTPQATSTQPLDKPASPITDLELPWGQVAIASPFYIERPPIESRCYAEIQKPGALIRIKAPRQMGKTSLMARLMQRANQNGDRTAVVDLQSAPQEVLNGSNPFLRWFCANVSQALRIPPKAMQQYWEFLDGNTACKAYFEDCLLPQLSAPLTLAINEVDLLFEHPEVFRDFFGLLRALHEEAKRNEIWSRLRLVIVHSTEVYVPMDLNQSPFNVGLAIDLPEFTLSQVQTLVQRHQLTWEPSESETLMSLLGGHPFLIRLALYHIAEGDCTLSELCQTATAPTGFFENHLSRCEDILKQHPDLLEAMCQVIYADHPITLKPSIRFKLKSLGLVKLDAEGAVPGNPLYYQYFRKVLKKPNQGSAA